MLNSYPIRALSKKETSAIQQDLQNFDHYADVHYVDRGYLTSGGLRDGKSVWISNDSGDLLIQKDFSNTITVIDQIKHEMNYSLLGRSYIHKLRPKEKIHRHTDDNEELSNYFHKIDRYQILLDLPSGLTISQPKSKFVKNSIIKFDHRSPHAYDNQSEENFFIIVFDFYQ
jgi:hypothetical protein